MTNEHGKPLIEILADQENDGLILEHSPEPVNVFSFGGGVQSMACLVLAAQKKIDASLFLFANTGDDAENPGTLKYLKEYAIPYAEQHGIELREIQKTDKQGNKVSLYQKLMSKPTSGNLPFYLSGNGMPSRRRCTMDFKIDVVRKEIKTLKQASTKVSMGISTDEFHRAKDSPVKEIEHQYPLLDKKISRFECGNIIRDAGLPVPPKSACFFCPYKRLEDWRTMAKDEPELFERACDLEKRISEARSDEQGPVYFTRLLKPLKEAIKPSEQLSLFDDDCSGFCMT